MTEPRWRIEQADCLEYLRAMPAGSCDLVFGSPPYEKARLYLENGHDLGIARDTEAWVAWMVEVVKASLHVCRGLVAFVVEGQTRKFRYTAGPALLMADLHRAGVHLRKPAVYYRRGVAGSGGTDWLKNNWEWIVFATNGGKLPWSDPLAMGKPPKYGPGGAFSNRRKNGERERRDKRFRDRGKSGGKQEIQHYKPPEIANPGNVIHCKVGGGMMGPRMAHVNEAPFPEKLVEFFIRSFCPPDGLVCDPFSGSGTTGAVALRWGRRFAGCDVRASQVALSTRRMESETPPMFAM